MLVERLGDGGGGLKRKTVKSEKGQESTTKESGTTVSKYHEGNTNKKKNTNAGSRKSANSQPGEKQKGRYNVLRYQ